MNWIITLRLPSGARFAMSSFEGRFALVPINGTVVRKASAWETQAGAEKYLEAQLKIAPDIEKLGPFTIEKVELPQ